MIFQKEVIISLCNSPLSPCSVFLNLWFIVYPMMLSEPLHDKVEYSSLPICALNIESMSRAPRLKAFAPPPMVPTFIMFPVLRTASKTLRNNMLDLSSVQAS